VRAVVALVLAVAACASAPPKPRTVEDDRPDQSAHLPAGPPQQVAAQIVKAQSVSTWGVTDAFMVVEVNVQSADNQRVREALAVLDAMATETDRKFHEMDDMFWESLEHLVDRVNAVLDQRLKTASCSLIFAVENTAGRWRALPGFVAPKATHSPFRDHRLSLRTLWCGLETINDKVAACGATHKGSGDAYVDVVVGTNGAVTSAVVMGKLANTPVGDCVSAAARTVTFPPSLGGSFDYPFSQK